MAKSEDFVIRVRTDEEARELVASVVAELEGLVGEEREETLERAVGLLGEALLTRAQRATTSDAVVIADRAIGCAHCGKAVALVGDELVTEWCLWCIAKRAPRAAAAFLADRPDSEAD